MSDIDYISVNITCKPVFVEILIAEFSELDYDSMLETESGLEAYIKPHAFDEKEVQHLAAKYGDGEISYSIQEVKEKNWNEEWEKSFDPIAVDDCVLVRATFHEPQKGFKHEIIITPRMSFGTGHHATTYLMLQNQFDIDHKNKSVLDAGCGTAILAIMAEKLGAQEVIAYDNSSWSTENAPFNIELNNCKNINVLAGTIATLNLQREFDIILANINKNILLEEMEAYSGHLSKEGTILFSGFYEGDEPDMKQAASKVGLKFVSKRTRKGWSSMVFKKS